jgi:hypothetical protein
MSAHVQPGSRLPIVEVLTPQEHRALILGGVAVALVAAGFALTSLAWPVWAATGLFLLLLAIPGVIKFRADARRYGLAIAVLAVLLVAQVLHSTEHIVQWIQNHLLGMSLRTSVGLLSPANAEWVHFVWNWGVLILVAVLIGAGMRNRWAWLLLAWAAAHTLEHTYLMWQHLDVLSQLDGFGVSGITAQGLPGLFGADGVLARGDAFQGTFLCRIPLLTTASRLDVHFGWNVGEVILLVLAAHSWLRSRSQPADPPAPPTGIARITTPEGAAA